MQECLLAVVDSGTAKHLKNDYYQFAGKTGTAKLVENGIYTHNYLASFAGYFPYDNPKYSIIVMVNSPSKGAFYGGAVAAPPAHHQHQHQRRRHRPDQHRAGNAVQIRQAGKNPDPPVQPEHPQEDALQRQRKGQAQGHRQIEIRRNAEIEAYEVRQSPRKAYAHRVGKKHHDGTGEGLH